MNHLIVTFTSCLRRFHPFHSLRLCSLLNQSAWWSPCSCPASWRWASSCSAASATWKTRFLTHLTRGRRWLLSPWTASRRRRLQMRIWHLCPRLVVFAPVFALCCTRGLARSGRTFGCRCVTVSVCCSFQVQWYMLLSSFNVSIP